MPVQADLAPIQRVFPEEMMNTIFSYLGPYDLGRAACVCKQWRHFSEVRCVQYQKARVSQLLQQAVGTKQLHGLTTQQGFIVAGALLICRRA